MGFSCVWKGIKILALVSEKITTVGGKHYFLLSLAVILTARVERLAGVLAGIIPDLTRGTNRCVKLRFRRAIEPRLSTPTSKCFNTSYLLEKISQ